MKQKPLDIVYSGIPGFPGYRIGDDGSVWSCFKRGWNKGYYYYLSDSWKKLRPSVSWDGYQRVTVFKEAVRYPKRVSVLVLSVFVGPCPEGMEACHENGNGLDNRISNLRWDTHKNNLADKKRHGTEQIGERNGA